MEQKVRPCETCVPPRAIDLLAESDGEDEEDRRESRELGVAIAPQTAARGSFVASFVQLSNSVEIVYRNDRMTHNDGWLSVHGLSVGIKSELASDKILVIANVPVTSTQLGSSWAFKRGEHRMGPEFKVWGSIFSRETLLMPWIDDPCKGVRARLDLSYSVQARFKGAVHVSKDKEQRQLNAVVIPHNQVSMAGAATDQSVTPGQWHVVQGLAHAVNTNEHERVLVICTINYRSLFCDEYSRGRFTIVRDGTGLDPDGYGLQSVRATSVGGLGASVPGRTLVMALVDDPHNGPHLYRVWAAVTTGEEQPHSTLVLESSTSTFTRQLTLLRLPPDVVSGPCRCDGQTVVEEDRWTEIVGLSVRVHVRHSRDRVLVVYHANFEPSGLRYDVFFTVFRETAHRQQNMGLESTGMWSVSSHAAASSEFPHAMFVDVPGRGTHTYSVWARTCRCDEQLVAEAVGVGPDGQIAVVLLEQSKSQGVSTAHL